MSSEKLANIKAKKTDKDSSDAHDTDVDSSDACEDNSSEDNPDLNLEIDEFDESTADVSTQENVKLNKPCRSNSVTIDDRGTPSPIRYSDRNLTEDCDVEKNAMKDAITISAISLEAGAKFYDEYHKNLKKDKTHNAQVNGTLKPLLIRKLSKNVDYSSVDKYDKAFSAFLKNKEPAHITAIIEGSRSHFPQTFTTQDSQGKVYEYILNSG